MSEKNVEEIQRLSKDQGKMLQNLGTFFFRKAKLIMICMRVGLKPEAVDPRKNWIVRLEWVCMV